MKKLYLATKTIEPSTKNVMFLCENKNVSKGYTLQDIAEGFFEEEERYHRKSENKETISIKEIFSIEEVPEEWKGYCLLWGSEDEITPTEFLSIRNSDPEYQEYLRLKEKFEK